MIEVTKKTYERFSRALSIAIATLLLILGLAAIVYVTSTALSIINSGTGSSEGGVFMTGAKGLLNILIIVLATGIGIVISIPYAVYVIDKLRSRGGSGISSEEL